MTVDGSGRVHLQGSVQLLHPEQQAFDELLAGWHKPPDAARHQSALRHFASCVANPA